MHILIGKEKINSPGTDLTCWKCAVCVFLNLFCPNVLPIGKSFAVINPPLQINCYSTNSMWIIDLKVLDITYINITFRKVNPLKNKIQLQPCEIMIWKLDPQNNPSTTRISYKPEYGFPK